jgi:phage regulator Rha-like protein
VNDLVFLEPNKIDAVPFTTSKVIAASTNNKHKSITQRIQQYQKDIEEFGKVCFRNEPLPSGQTGVYYELNEQQAYFLLTLLRNNSVVVAFKKELVKAFFLMRAELQKRQLCRAELKPIRRELTDVIKSIPEHSEWAYKQYTDLAYKTVLGKNAAQLRKERGAEKKAKAIDYMMSSEIEAVAKLQNQIGVLLEMGMDYYQIKSLLLNRQMVGKLSA